MTMKTLRRGSVPVGGTALVPRGRHWSAGRAGAGRATGMEQPR